MQRSDKRKMSLPMKIQLWVVGILFLLAIIAVIYVSAKIFITG
ncbi:LytR family transcriptional regulator, partial [Staphylococcus epidermidis]|nr:LytR family transcriptional regulator [Staphylococcus epidermidis]